MVDLKILELAPGRIVKLKKGHYKLQRMWVRGSRKWVFLGDDIKFSIRELKYFTSLYTITKYFRKVHCYEFELMEDGELCIKDCELMIGGFRRE